jgi:hypothetical protein
MMSGMIEDERWEDYLIVLRPERNEPDWWAGAPSVARIPDADTYLATRMREAISARGKRGYEVRILRSTDGKRFGNIAKLKREEVPIAGFERPSLLYDPDSGLFSIYLCGPWPFEGEGNWSILRLDDVEDPEDFDPSTATPVLCPNTSGGERDYGVKGYKDPFVWFDGRRYRMLVIGYHPERTYLFVSDDGRKWSRVGDGPWFDLGGWHTFYTRPACVLPMGAGYLFVYEGSHPEWFDPPYNIATGLAWSPDMRSCVDLTPREPYLKSSTPGRYHTWRYSHWMWREGQLWVYAEVACENDTNEVRLFRLDLD